MWHTGRQYTGGDGGTAQQLPLEMKINKEKIFLVKDIQAELQLYFIYY